MPTLRLQITKEEPVRYISHLDYMRAWERALRRSGLPVAYTSGFNPHIRLSFAAPLAVGVTSEAEYVDIPMAREVAIEEVMTALAAVLPPGISARQGRYVAVGTPSLPAAVAGAVYTVTAPLAPGASPLAVTKAVTAFQAAEQVIFVKDLPKGRRQVDARSFVRHLTVEVDDGKVVLTLDIRITAAGSVKPAEVLAVLQHDFALPVLANAALIHRVRLYAWARGHAHAL